MATLREYFIVEQLQNAAINNDQRRLQLVREIVKRIKLSQLDKFEIASDKMVATVLQQLKTDLLNDLTMIDDYLDHALSQTK